MAAKFLSLTFLAATFLQLSLARPGSTPSLFLQPEPRYFVGKDQPVKLVCAARNAEDLSFSCVGVQIPPTSTETEEAFEGGDDEESQYVMSIQSSITIPRGDVINYQRQQKAEMAATGVKGERPGSFWCECSVLDMDGEVVETSRRSIIRLAHLRHRWVRQPEDTLVDAGTNAELFCDPPAGHPEPQISWTKDSLDVSPEDDERVVITDRGSLVITDVNEDDAGIYRCQATNIAGSRSSRLAELSVAGDVKLPHRKVVVTDEDGQRVEIVKSRTPRQSPEQADPIRFTVSPAQNIFVSEENPEAEVKCNAVGVDLVSFFCNGRAMHKNRHKISSSTGQTRSGSKIVQTTLTVNYDFVRRQNANRLHCYCTGYTRVPGGLPKQIQTDKRLGHVHIATLEDEFKREPQDAMLEEGAKQAVVHCRLPHGEPKPWVHWYKDGQELDLRRLDNKYTPSKQNLVIHNIEMSDAGVYVCEAKNIAGNSRSRPGTIRVRKTGTPEPTQDEGFKWLTDLPEESFIGDDGKVELVCSTTKVHRLLPQCNRHQVDADSIQLTQELNDDNIEVSVLRFTVSGDQVSSRRSYGCQCVADYRNETVRNWERFYSTKSHIKLQESATERKFIGDEFVRVPRDKEVDIKSQVRLHCQPPSGNPSPKVYWLKDGQRIIRNKDPNVVLYRQGNLLALREARAEDAGLYTCVAENSEGKIATDPVQLVVRGEATTTPPPTTPDVEVVDPEVVDPTETPDTTTPFFVEEPAELTYVAARSEVNLTCQVVGTQTVFFICNGDRQDHTNRNGGVTRYGSTARALTTSYMTVTADMVNSFFGAYTCKCQYHYRAETGYEDPSSRDSVVKIAYLKRRFASDPRALTSVEIGSEVQLECNPPQGDPEPEVMWVKDRATVQYSEAVRLLGSNLVISYFTEEDEGEYVCVATNLAATRYSNALPIYKGLVIEPAEPTSEPTSEPAGTTKPPGPVTDSGAGQPEPETTPGTGTGTGSETGTGVISDPSQFYRPYFSKDLLSSYYVVNDKPAVLDCEAFNINQMIVSCYGRDLDYSELTISVREVASKGPNDAMIMEKATRAEFEVNAADLESADSDSEYGCACYGTYKSQNGDEEQIQSSYSRVYLAYIDDAFVMEPENSVAALGGFVMMRCSPPAGNPMPLVTWLKDGQPVTMHTIMPGGQLAIHSVTQEDQGTYICTAENVAGRRESRPVTFQLMNIQPATESVTPGVVIIGGGDGGGADGATDGRRPGIEDTTPAGVVVQPGGSTGTEGGTTAGGEEGETSQKGEVSPGAGGPLETDPPTDSPPVLVVTEGGDVEQDKDKTDQGGMSGPSAEPSAEPPSTGGGVGEGGVGGAGGVTDSTGLTGEVDVSIPEGEPTQVPEPEISASSVDGSESVPDGEPGTSAGSDGKDGTAMPEPEPSASSGSGMKEGTGISEGQTGATTDTGDEAKVPVGEPDSSTGSDGEDDKVIPEGEPDTSTGSGTKDDTLIPEGETDSSSGSDRKGDKASPEGEPDGTSSTGDKTVPEGEPDSTGSTGTKDVSISEGEPTTGGDGVTPGSEPEPGSDSKTGDGSATPSGPEGGVGEPIDGSVDPSPEPGSGTKDEGSMGDKQGTTGDDMGPPPPPVDEGTGTAGGGKVPIGVIPGGDSQGRSDSCVDKALACQNIAPRDYDTCQDTSAFEACLADMRETCTQETIDSLETHLNNCEFADECRDEMKRCQPLYTNDGKFDVYALCAQAESYISCTDSALEACGTVMYHVPSEIAKIPMDDMGMDIEVIDEPPEIERVLLKDWFSQYCEELVTVQDTDYSVASCSTMADCDFLTLWKMVAGRQSDNNTFWCSSMETLMLCSHNAIGDCGLEELRAPEEDLQTMYLDLCDSMLEELDDGEILPGTDGMGEGTDNGEENTGEETTGGEGDGDDKDGNEGTDDGGDGGDGDDKDGNEGTDDGGDGGDGGGDTSDPDASATKQGQDKDSSSVAGVSLLLTVSLQLAVAAILSRR